MKLRRVVVHNFRGILDEEVELSDYSLLVGPNNAGKSTVINAIRAFYEKDKFQFKSDSDLPFFTTKDRESWIELTFNLSDEEFASLKDDYKVTPNELRVRKCFQTSGKTQDKKSATGFIFAYKQDGTLSDDPFYGAKNVQSGKFGDLVYIPAVSKIDDHTKLSGPSALRDLVTDIISDLVEDSAAYAEFSGNVQKFATAIRTEETTDNRSLAGFESELNGLLGPWQTKFGLKMPPPSASEIIKSMLGWELIDEFHGHAQSIDGCGSGFQRHLIHSLIQLGARYIGRKASKKSKDFSPSMTLVLFEEPEAFLHPPQQEVLARNLMAMAKASHWQVLCSTHSSHFVSKNTEDIPAIARLKREDGKVRIFQVSPSDWTSLADANQAIISIASKYPKMHKKLNADDMKPEMEALKYCLWLNPDRCSMFFANHVFLVEGATEVALLNKLMADDRICVGDGGLYVLDCMGKYNIHRFMNLLKYLGTPHSVLHDDDRSKEEHAEINQLIHDSGNPLTFAIKLLPGDLEAVLGIPKAGADHRKPQHVLFQYEAGKIDPKKLEAFCTLAESCLPPSKVVPTAPAAAT